MIRTQQNSRVEVRDLTIGYGSEPVLKELSFSVRKGEILAVLGGSGCGKSTLLKHLTGLLEPMHGDIFIDGENLTRLQGEARRKVMRRFGVLYQSGALFGSLTVAENIMLPLEEFTVLSPDERRACAESQLALVGMEGTGGLMPAELSGGMKKRAGLARAMALDPPLLFFDEPSAGLDPITSASLDRLILDLRRRLGTTMVIVTHELPSVFAVADRVILLDKNARGMIAEGSPDALLSDSDERVQAFMTRDGTDCRVPHTQKEKTHD